MASSPSLRRSLLMMSRTGPEPPVLSGPQTPQDVNNSIEAQTAECKLFARNNNMAVVAIFIDEAESGRSDNRSKFQRMVTEATGQDKPFEVVLN